MVKDFLSWVKIFIKATPSERTRMKHVLLSGISNHSVEGKKYTDWLKSSSCEFIGFAVNVQYVKEKGENDELEALWVHPFGSPVLLYKHKRLPMLIMTSPSLEFNDSHIKKAKMNNYTQDIEGITD